MLDFIKERLVASKANANTSRQSEPSSSLNVEPLEERMMLSTVDIFATGATGSEELMLVVNDQVVETFTNVGGDSNSGQFEKFTVQLDEQVTAGQIRIQFSNDFYDPDNNFDRNLTVERIVIDGETFETNQGDVFSTGTWTNNDGIVPGFGRGNTLHANGYFQFGGDATATESLQLIDQVGAEALLIEVDPATGRYATLSRSGFNASGDVVTLFNADGSVATEFGDNGSANIRTLTGLSPGDDFTITDLGIFSDGSVLLTGNNGPFDADSTPHLLKLDSTGAVDSSFNNGFFNETQLGIRVGDSGIFRVVVDPSGNATVIGNAIDSNNDVILVRLTANGQVDTSFGNNGQIRVTGPGTGSPANSRIIGAEVLANGTVIVAAVNDDIARESATTLLAKVQQDGTFDSTFGINGIATVDAGDRSFGFENFEVDSQERVLLASNREIIRLNVFGGLDSTFNDDGRFEFSDGQFLQGGVEPFGGIAGFVVDNQDRLILTSNLLTVTGGPNGVVFNFDGTTVVRLGVDGQFDSSFDDDGVQILDFSSTTFPSGSSRVSVDSDDNLLVSIGPTGPNPDPVSSTPPRLLSRFEFVS